MSAFQIKGNNCSQKQTHLCDCNIHTYIQRPTWRMRNVNGKSETSDGAFGKGE